MRRLQTIAQASFVFAIVLCGFVTSVQAQIKVGVEKFEGAKEGKVRKTVQKVLKKKKIKVVTAKTIDAKAAELGANMDSNEDRVRVARELELNAYISGSVEREGRKWVATVLVTNGGDGSVLEEKEFKHRKYNRMLAVVSKRLWGKLGGAIKSGEVPTAPVVEAPVAEAQPDSQVAETPEPEPTPSHRAKYAPLEVEAGLDFFTRSYTYDNDKTQTLRPYDLGGAPAGKIALNWYPLAHFQDGFAANIGLTGRFSQAFGLTSETSDGGAFPTSSSAMAAGLRLRFPSDKWQASTAVVYGIHDFSIEDDGATDKPLIPSVTYNYVGIEGAARVEVMDALSVITSLSYRQVLSAGELDEPRFFPNASAWGLAAFLGIGTTYIDPVEIRLGFDVQRYALDLGTKAGDPLEADGAIDQYLGGSLTVATHFGGAD